MLRKTLVLFFLEIWTTNLVPAQEFAILTSSGICWSDCDFGSDDLHHFTNKTPGLKPHPGEIPAEWQDRVPTVPALEFSDGRLEAVHELPDLPFTPGFLTDAIIAHLIETSGAARIVQVPFTEYFIFRRDFIFWYCLTQQNFYVRCSQDNHTTATFQRIFRKERFKGYAVDSPECESECQINGQELGCNVGNKSRPFRGTHQCSLRIDHGTYNRDFYQLSTYGLILGRPLWSSRCYSLSNSELGFESLECANRRGFYDISGAPCLSDCKYGGTDLQCATANNAASGCYINMKNAGTPKPRCNSLLDEEIKLSYIQLLNEDSYVKTSQARKSDDQPVDPGSSYCVENGILVLENFIYVSKIKEATSNFTCNRHETSRYIIMLATDTVFIDEDIFVYGGLGRIFSHLIMIGKTIEVTRPTVVNITGSHWIGRIGNWVNGGNGSNFVAAGLEFKNAELLTIDASGGNAGCGIKPKYTETTNTRTSRMSEVYVQVDFSPTTTTDSTFTRFMAAEFDKNTPEFEVFSVLDEFLGNAGTAGFIYINGSKIEGPTIIQNNGTQHACTSPIRDLENCVKLVYMGNGQWFKFPFLEHYFPEYSFNESYFYPIRRWVMTLNNDWEDEDILKISTVIDHMQSSLALDSITMFYEELKIIIVNSKIINNKLEVKLVRSLRDRIAGFRGSEDYDLLNWEYATAQAHIRRIQGQDTLVADIRAFVINRETNIGMLVNVIQESHIINEVARGYTIQTEDKIRNAEQLIRRQVLPQMDEIGRNIEAQLNMIDREIQAILQQTMDTLVSLSMNLQKAVSARNYKLFFNSLKIVGGAIGFFGKPAGELIGAGVSGIGSLGVAATDIVLKRNFTKLDTDKIKSDVWTNIKPCSDWIDKQRDRLIKILEKILDQFSDDNNIRAFIEVVEFSLQELRTVDPKKDKRFTKQDQFAKIREVENRLDDEIKKLPSLTSRSGFSAKTLQGRQKDDNPIDYSGILKQTVSGFTDLVTDLAKGNAEIAKYEEEIQKAHAAIDTLVQFSKDFHYKIMPMALSLIDTFDLVTETLNASKLATIDVATWNIETSINDVLDLIKEQLSSFQAAPAIISSIQGVSRTVRTVATLFGRIVAAKDELRLLGVMTGLEKSDLNDPRVDAMKKNMENAMLEAIMFAEVDIAWACFRQWAFPFAHEFLSSFDPLPFSIENMSYSGIDTTALLKLKEIRSILENNELYLNGADEHLTHGTFIRSDEDGLDPFFTWDYNVYNSSIRKLLEAKGSVHFYADVNLYTLHERNPGKEAIKFKSINFQFHVVNNETKSKILDRELRRCKLTAVHMGYSYYRFRGKNYLFTSANVMFGNSSGGYLNTNAKYMSGTPVLSPYGLWKFKIQGKKSYDLSNLLTRDADIVNLELVGTGTFVDTTDSDESNEGEPGIDELYLDRYYKTLTHPDENNFNSILEACRPKIGQHRVFRAAKMSCLMQ